MKSVEMIGKTVEEAVELALKELGANEDEVQIEVVDSGAKGFLGMGSRDAKVVVTYNFDPEKVAKKFLDGLFEAWGEEVEVWTRLDEDILRVELAGDNMGVVIGKRGDTLDAIQYLVSLCVNKGQKDFLKVSVDTENYREKRNKTLESLSKKLAIRVAKTRKNMTLEPMNSYERRIIHATLQNDRYVTTYSIGQAPNRRVVIAYNKK
ncbi:MAG: protein jag [Ruminococcaceae bacterium]|nr:protein jag [Oscillospiraceae bacterium]